MPEPETLVLVNECRLACVALIQEIIKAFEDHKFELGEGLKIGLKAFNLGGHLVSIIGASDAKQRQEVLWILEHAIYAIPGGMPTLPTTTTTQEYQHE